MAARGGVTAPTLKGRTPSLGYTDDAEALDRQDMPKSAGPPAERSSGLARIGAPTSAAISGVKTREVAAARVFR